MQVKDVMTSDVVYAKTGDSVEDVAKLMKHHNIGCVPVVENGDKVLGVITDRDIVLRGLADDKNVENLKVENIMTPHVFSVKPDADVTFAIELMEKQQIRRLPVIENDKLYGIVALGDFAVTEESFDEAGEALTEISWPSEVENI